MAGDVRVVLATDSPPFREATAALTDSLERNRPSDLLTVQSKGADLSSADLIIALGSDAIGPESPGDVPILHCMTMLRPEHGAAVILRYPVADQLALMRDAFPRSTRIGVVYSTDDTSKIVNEAIELSADYNLKIVAVRIDGPESLQGALNGLSNRADLIWAVPDPTLYTRATAQTVLVYSFRARLPFMGLSDQWAKAGAAIAPSFDYAAIGHQCSELAGILLDGKSASEVGVRSPYPLQYSINRNSLNQMKVFQGKSLIEKARHVY
jgi:putative ABC transport system substrate-binding protein